MKLNFTYLDIALVLLVILILGFSSLTDLFLVDWMDDVAYILFFIGILHVLRSNQVLQNQILNGEGQIAKETERNTIQQDVINNILVEYSQRILVKLESSILHSNDIVENNNQRHEKIDDNVSKLLRELKFIEQDVLESNRIKLDRISNNQQLYIEKIENLNEAQCQLSSIFNSEFKALKTATSESFKEFDDISYQLEQIKNKLKTNVGHLQSYIEINSHENNNLLRSELKQLESRLEINRNLLVDNVKVEDQLYYKEANSKMIDTLKAQFDGSTKLLLKVVGNASGISQTNDQNLEKSINELRESFQNSINQIQNKLQTNLGNFQSYLKINSNENNGLLRSELEQLESRLASNDQNREIGISELRESFQNSINQTQITLLNKYEINEKQHGNNLDLLKEKLTDLIIKNSNLNQSIGENQVYQGKSIEKMFHIDMKLKSLNEKITGDLIILNEKIDIDFQEIQSEFKKIDELKSNIVQLGEAQKDISVESNTELQKVIVANTNIVQNEIEKRNLDVFQSLNNLQQVCINLEKITKNQFLENIELQKYTNKKLEDTNLFIEAKSQIIHDTSSDTNLKLDKVYKSSLFKKLDKPPIIIGGCGRSGTTLLLSMLSSHPKILGIPEETYVFCPKAYSGDLDIDNPFDIDNLFTDHLSKLELLPTHDRWCEKSPKNVHFFKRILEYIEDVKLINVIRDGRDVTLSKHPTDTNKYWVPIERWIDDVNVSFELKNHPQVLTIRYEDIVTNYAATMKKVCKHIGVDYNHYIDNWYKYASVKTNIAYKNNNVKPLFNSSLEKWKLIQHKNKTKEFMKNEEAVELLKKLGYIKGKARKLSPTKRTKSSIKMRKIK